MRYKILVIVFFIIFFSVSLFAQDNYFKHTVLKGETVTSISQKYKITPNDLYKLNPKLIDGIFENEVILIPKSNLQNDSKLQVNNIGNQTIGVKKINHEVQPKETKYGLSKQYGLTIEQLEQQNPQIVNGLQVGHNLQISVISNSTKQLIQTNVNSTSTSSNSTTHYVLPKETLYGISKRYGLTVGELEAANQDVLSGILRSGQTLTIPVKNSNLYQDGNVHLVQAGETKYGLSKKYTVSIEELERLNPQIVRMLIIGQQLQIPGNSSNQDFANNQKVNETNLKNEKNEESKSVKIIEQPKKQEISPSENYVSYEVQPKETLYGLSKLAGLTQDQFLNLNPEIENGLKIGMIIKMPSNSGVSSITSSLLKNSSTNLVSSLNKVETKKVAFLVPINEDDFSIWEANPIASLFITNTETKKITDFYLGSKMAIDSLKSMGVKIDDSYYSAVSKNALSVVKKNNLDKVNMVFYPADVNPIIKIEESLSKNNVPFLSFSTDNENKRGTNSFSIIPTEIQMKNAVLDYLKQNNFNVIIVNDPIRKESKAYIQTNYPEFKFATIDNKGMVDINTIQKYLKSSQKNVVVLDTDKSGLILDTTTFLLKESTNYTLQMAILESKDKIEKEGLSEMRFKVLKMIHPSYSYVNNKNLVEKFDANFKRKFNYASSVEAIHGFDCTFDAMLRLFQNNNFETIAKDEKSTQLLHQFNYVKNQMGGYSNYGIYLLQYDNENDSKRIN